MTVRTPDLFVKKATPFERVMDQHLREFYGNDMRIDPAILAYKLGTRIRVIENRLSFLGLRKKRHAGT
jgi:hypothetical protein